MVRCQHLAWVLNTQETELQELRDALRNGRICGRWSSRDYGRHVIAHETQHHFSYTSSYLSQMCPLMCLSCSTIHFMTSAVYRRLGARGMVNNRVHGAART